MPVVCQVLTECQQEPVAHAEDEGVPSLVLQIEQGVDPIAKEQGEQHNPQVFEGHLQWSC